MMERTRKFLVLASLFGATGVALGAFAGHGLQSAITPEMLSVFQTGVRYQMYHTFALFVTCWLMSTAADRKFSLAAWLFVVGILLFSGSLYILALSDITSFGWITPFGGLALLGGWVALGWGIVKTKSW